MGATKRFHLECNIFKTVISTEEDLPLGFLLVNSVSCLAVDAN